VRSGASVCKGIELASCPAALFRRCEALAEQRIDGFEESITIRPGHEAKIELFVTRYQVVDGWMDGGGGGQVMRASGEENEVENESLVPL